MQEATPRTSPVFARADECSGSNYTCNGCGGKWGDHVAPGSQCAGGAPLQTASEKVRGEDQKALAIEEFALKAWMAHATGAVNIEPLSKTLKSRIGGAFSECFPLHASAVRVDGHGVATYHFCMTDHGINICTVMSATDMNGHSIIAPKVVAYNRVEALLHAVRDYMDCISQASELAPYLEVLEDRNPNQQAQRERTT